MKKFSIEYHETYGKTYEIEAETKEETEEILKERIREGMEDAPEECENSWCDNVQEMDNKEKNSFENKNIFCQTDKEIIEILAEAEKCGYKWRSGVEPLKYIPETICDGVGVILFFDKPESKVITFLSSCFKDINFDVLFAKNIIQTWMGSVKGN